jgi:hypothetical protein
MALGSDFEPKIVAFRSAKVAPDTGCDLINSQPLRESSTCHLSRMGTVRFDSPQAGEVEPKARERVET